jgi:hypothetical protein
MLSTIDILPNASGPALSATSDFPVIEAPAAVAPAAEAPAAASPSTPAAPPAEGTADATPPTEGDTPAAEAPAAEGTEGEAGEEGEGEADGQVAAEGEDGEPPAATPPPSRPTPGQQIKGRMATLAEARRVAEEEARAANARADRMEKMVEEVLSRIPKPEPAVVPPEPPPPPPQPRPTRETFETPDAYDEAMVQWARSEERRELIAQQAEAARIAQAEREAAERAAQAEREAVERATAERIQQENFSAMQSAHAARVAKATEKWPDYEEITTKPDLKISLPMAEAILRSDDGPDAAYHLAKNPAEAERIAAMIIPGQVFPATLPDGTTPHPFAGQPVPDVQRQLIEMGKIFAILAAPAEPFRPRPRPPAPAPINPLRRSSAVAVEPSLEEIGNDTSSDAMEKYAQLRIDAIRAENRRH